MFALVTHALNGEGADKHMSKKVIGAAYTMLDGSEAIENWWGLPVSVIGGAEIFELFLPLADRLELTEVLQDVPGDTFMPDPRASGGWREIAREEHAAEGETPAFAFVTLEKG